MPPPGYHRWAVNIHEHQAKELLSSYGVTVPLGTVAFTPEQAGAAAASLMERTGGHMVIIKAQIHAGGRGKGRFREHPDAGLAGVNVVASGQTSLMGERMTELAEKMLGSTLVTVQTGPSGKVVNRVLLEAAVEITQELYLAIQLDRRIARPVLLASTEGGVEIEEVAASSPEKLHTEIIDPAVGVRPFQLRRLARRLGLSGAAASDRRSKPSRRVASRATSTRARHPARWADSFPLPWPPKGLGIPAVALTAARASAVRGRACFWGFPWARAIPCRTRLTASLSVGSAWPAAL